MQESFGAVLMPGDERFGGRQIAMIRDAGIRRFEICGLYPPTHYDFRDRAQVDEIISECRSQGVSVVSMHGPAVPYGCPYEEVRRATVKVGVAAARVAEEMGASIFVAHFDTNDSSEKTVREMLDQLEGSSIKVAIENDVRLGKGVGPDATVDQVLAAIGAD